MKKLFKHELDHQLSYRYFQENLEDVNELSIVTIKSINFQEGKFYTLLPENSNRSKLHQFTLGEIVSTAQPSSYQTFGEASSYSTIPTIEKEISQKITEMVMENENLIFLADDVLRLRQDKNIEESLRNHMLFYEQNVYYLLTHATISRDLVQTCFRESKSFWHSLIILSEPENDYSSYDELTQNAIKDICEQAKMVIIGAYDGEGYIFWEKN